MSEWFYGAPLACLKADVDAGARLLLVALWSHAPRNAAPIVWPSLERLGDLVGASRSTVYRQVQTLVDADLVERITRHRFRLTPLPGPWFFGAPEATLRSPIDATLRVTLLALWSHVHRGQEDAIVWPGIDQPTDDRHPSLCEMTGRSRSTVYAHLAALESAGYLARTDRTGFYALLTGSQVKHHGDRFPAVAGKAASDKSVRHDRSSQAQHADVNPVTTHDDRVAADAGLQPACKQALGAEIFAEGEDQIGEGFVDLHGLLNRPRALDEGAQRIGQGVDRPLVERPNRHRVDTLEIDHADAIRENDESTIDAVGFSAEKFCGLDDCGQSLHDESARAVAMPFRPLSGTIAAPIESTTARASVETCGRRAYSDDGFDPGPEFWSMVESETGVSRADYQSDLRDKTVSSQSDLRDSLPYRNIQINKNNHEQPTHRVGVVNSEKHGGTVSALADGAGQGSLFQQSERERPTSPGVPDGAPTSPPKDITGALTAIREIVANARRGLGCEGARARPHPSDGPLAVRLRRAGAPWPGFKGGCVVEVRGETLDLWTDHGLVRAWQIVVERKTEELRRRAVVRPRDDADEYVKLAKLAVDRNGTNEAVDLLLGGERYDKRVTPAVPWYVKKELRLAEANEHRSWAPVAGTEPEEDPDDLLPVWTDPRVQNFSDPR